MRHRKKIVTGSCLLVALVFGSYAQSQKSGMYGDYYQRTVGGRHARDPGTTRFLYDKYFYHNPSISPYVSAIRGGSQYGPAYYTSVQPELARRDAAQRSQYARSKQQAVHSRPTSPYYPGPGAVGANRAARPMPPQRVSPVKPNPYFNQMYRTPYNR